MKVTKIYIIALLWLSSSTAQEYHFDRLTEKDGLPANNTYSILKDHDGFMWFGTANGLCRYDGVDFTHFNQEQGYNISNDHINELIQDSEGMIWIGTNTGGLNAFNPKTNSFQSFTHDPANNVSIASDRIQSIVEGDSGTLWIGFDNGHGFSKFDKNTKQFTNFDPFEPFNLPGVKAIRDIVYDAKRDKLWLGTTNGIISFDINSQKFQLINHPLSSRDLHGLFALEQIDEDRLIGGFFHAGLDIYDIKNEKWEGVFSNPSDRIRIFNLSRKSKTEFWVAARRKGLATFNLETNTLSFVPSELDKHNTPFPGFTYEVYGDSSEVWVGNKQGVSFASQNVDPFQFNSLNFSNPEMGRVYEISGRYDKIYIVGYNKQIWEINKSTGETVSYSIPISSVKHVTSILELEDRLYMIGGDKTVLLFDKKTKVMTQLDTKAIRKKASFGSIKKWTDDKAIIRSRYGGTYTLGLSNNEISPFKPSIIPDEWQHDAMIQNDGNLWIATASTVIIYDPERDSVQFYGPESIKSKRQKHIHCLVNDAQGNTWMGTGHGILKIENGKETIYNVLNSDLPSNQVTDIKFDKCQNMWALTTKGISKIDPNTMEMIHYGSSDGINHEGTLNEVDGEIYYGVLGGYFNLSKRNDPLHVVEPVVHLVDFQVAGEQIFLDSIVNLLSQIELEYWQNSFSFSYSSPEYRESNKIRYAYRLVGLTEDWTFDESRRFANYTNLDGGNYTFEVKVRSQDGQWSKVKAIRIYLDLPFWETWWFYLLCGLSLAVSGFVFYKTRINSLQRKADQEAQELRLEAFQKRLMDLNATPPDLVLHFEKLNEKLNSPLREREFEALELSLDGKTNTEIADRLFISKSTVKFHLRNAYAKLGVQNRKEALQYVSKSSNRN